MVYLAFHLDSLVIILLYLSNFFNEKREDFNKTWPCQYSWLSWAIKRAFSYITNVHNQLEDNKIEYIVAEF